MTELTGAVVLITGAGGGFGREMMRQYAAEGCSILAHDVDAGLLRAAIAEVFDDEGQVSDVHVADLATAEGCKGLFDAVTGDGHLPDVIVNNAGIGVGGRIDLMPYDRWEKQLQINLLSPMRISQHFLPAMLARGSGHFVNISSIAGWVGAGGLSTYCASKFGLRGFSESLRQDLAPHGIRVSTVYPWFSRTPILDSELFGMDDNIAVPDDMVTDPADVVAEIVRGTRGDVSDIFPDRMARRVQFLKRHFPRLLGLMTRRLDRRLRGAQASP